MPKRNENIRILNCDSVVIILVVLLGFLVFRNPGNINHAEKKPAAAYISVNDKSAVSNPQVILQVFQKTWILNKDNFDILAFNRNPLAENKKTDLKINILFLKTREFTGSPGVFLRTHLFPHESDDPFDLV